MDTNIEPEFRTIEEYQNAIAQDLAEDIKKELGVNIPFEQLRRYETRKNKRMIRYCSLFNGRDFSLSNYRGFRTVQIPSEPDSYWVSLYNSLDYVCKRKVTFGVAEDGKPSVTFSDEQITMIVRTDEGILKRIKIISKCDNQTNQTVFEFFELEIED